MYVVLMALYDQLQKKLAGRPYRSSLLKTITVLYSMKMHWKLYCLILELETVKSLYCQLLVPTARENRFFSTFSCGIFMQR